MRILFVTPYLPVPPDFGGALRMYHLIREAARRHEVITLSLVGPGDDPRPAEGEIGRVIPVLTAATARMPPGRAKRAGQVRSLLSTRSFQYRFYRHPAMQREIDRVARAERVDVVQFEFSQMGLYQAPPGIPAVLDVHNIEYAVLRQVATSGSPPRRLFNQIEYRKFRREEIDAWRRANVCLATSRGDAEEIRRRTDRPVAVVPNGVDAERFRRTPLDGTDPASLVFVGAMRYRPNADAAHFFVRDVLPRLRERLPNARLAIVGADPPPEVLALGREQGVEVTGTVSDVRPWVARAGTVVVPLLSGGGTRLKILEAFAMGRPVVSTTIGASGIDARDGEHLLLADSPVGFVAAIERLARDPALRERLANRAHDLVRERYQWTAVARGLDDVYCRLHAR